MKGDIVKCAYCGKEFIQSKTGHKYCSKVCKNGGPPKGKYNPAKLTSGTIYTTIAFLEKGEKIEDIEKDFNRQPGQLKEIIDKLKDGEYDKIVKQIKKGSESPACFNSYKISRPMHQQNIICYD